MGGYSTFITRERIHIPTSGFCSYSYYQLESDLATIFLTTRESLCLVSQRGGAACVSPVAVTSILKKITSRFPQSEDEIYISEGDGPLHTPTPQGSCIG